MTNSFFLFVEFAAVLIGASWPWFATVVGSCLINGTRVQKFRCKWPAISEIVTATTPSPCLSCFHFVVSLGAMALAESTGCTSACNSVSDTGSREGVQCRCFLVRFVHKKMIIYKKKANIKTNQWILNFFDIRPFFRVSIREWPWVQFHRSYSNCCWHVYTDMRMAAFNQQERSPKRK